MLVRFAVLFAGFGMIAKRGMRTIRHGRPGRATQ